MLSDPVRTVTKKKPCTSKGKSKQHKAGAANPTDPKGISPSIRVKEFPGKCLRVRIGKLFCVACREELALKKGTIKNHIEGGNKYLKAKEKLAQKDAKERDIAESLKAYDREVQPAGTSVAMEVRVYRAKVVEYFLQAGIPLAKIDELRGLLEKNAFRLCHSSHLADYIPPILRNEKLAIRQEIEGKGVSVHGL